jgi:uncharacterized membrane protein YvbJ
MFCKKCGSKIEDGSKFCVKCGEEFFGHQTPNIRAGFPLWGKILLAIVIVFVSLIALSTILFLIAPLLQ